jgi:hypothetical protein
MRLWALEQNRPTLVNIQAICVLAYEFETHLTLVFPFIC